MTHSSRHTLMILFRILVLTAFFVGPVGAFTYAYAGTQGGGMAGAGFVLFVSLQRNAG